MNAGTRPIIDRNVSMEAPRPKIKGASMASHAQKISAALFASVLIGSGVFILLVSTAPSAGWVEYYPISINGNSEFTEAKGVVNGTGSLEYPFIISGWEISNYAWDGISIMHTTAYFVIRDVHINSTSGGTLDHAIYLEDVSNGTIESSLMNSTAAGIYMTGCDNITISNVEILECSGWAIYSVQSRDIGIVDSSISSYNGVHAQDGSRLDVLRCDVEGVVYGVDFSNVDNSTVLSSSFLDCDYGVNIVTADRCNVSGNAVQDCVRGIRLVYIYNSDIGGNAVSYIDSIGISVYDGSYNNTVRSNLVMNCSDVGILMDWMVYDCVVWNNTMVNNTSSWYSAGGMVLWDCDDILVYHNVFTDNTPAHAYDNSVADNRWNESYPTGGNYWDDYTGDDVMNGAGQDLNGSDGIGDTAHCFDGDTSDCYPLMAAPTSNTAPVASFSVDPVTADAGVEFSFDASGSSDAEDTVEDLQVRWDWDGDGNWDTGYSTDKTATHVYSIPDTYTVKMEVMDTGGLTDIATETVVVTGTPIPEFSSLVVPVLAVMALFLVARRRRAG